MKEGNNMSRELERIEQLKHHEELLYNCIEYLLDLWDINETNDEMKEHFKKLNFKEEDIESLVVGMLY